MTNAKFINACIQACGNWGILPTEFNSCMTWEEQVLWIARFLQEQVIPTVNENTEAFNTLKTYVENYFDNLDVQEEIDNKLDEMAEDGTLIDLIGEYLQSNVTWTFNTVAEMKAATNLTAGGFARTLGFYAANDGGGATYKISDTGTANEKDVIAIGSTLYGVLQHEPNVINVDCLGAKGDGETDDTTIIEYAINNYDFIRFGAKNYYLPSGIFVPSYKSLKGYHNFYNDFIGYRGTVFTGNNTSHGIKLYDAASSYKIVEISDITVEKYTVGIYGIYVTNSTFENISCRQNGIGAEFEGNAWINNFRKCTFNHNTGDGFKIGFTVTHPLNNSLTVSPNIATFDFDDCSFAANGGYGFNGWARVFNFYGGFAEHNTLGGVRCYNTNSNVTQVVNFNGFDIEAQNKGYIFEGEDRVDVSNVYIDGGQIALSGDNPVAITFKGNSCNWTYVHDIKVNSRITTNSLYDIDVQATGAKTVQMDIDTGNRNNATIRTNADQIIPNGLVRTNAVVPVLSFGYAYMTGDDLSGSCTVPNGKSVEINIDGLTFLDQVTVTTSAAATFSMSNYGTPLTTYKRTGFIGSASSTLVDDVNTTVIGAGVACSKIILTNKTGSDVTITSVTVNGLIRK